MEGQNETKKRKTPTKKEPAKTITKDESPVGHIAKIKPETTKFLGGTAIPHAAFVNEMYVQSDNHNGTVILAFSDTTIPIESLFVDSLEILEEKRTFTDETTECPNVSIRIMGVPSREGCILENKKRLGVDDDCIFIDSNRTGAKENAKRAWLHPTDKEYVMVLQDDVELCDNFLSYVNDAIKVNPDAIISFFPIEFLSSKPMPRLESPYVSTTLVSGCCIVMPTKYVEQCIGSWKDEIGGDDTNIRAWAIENNVEIITTIPSTVQHTGDISVNSPGLVIGRTRYYRKNLSDYDFKNSYINNGWNMKQRLS